MRFVLVLALFTGISFSASAQWWRISLKKHERFPQIYLQDRSVERLPKATFTARIIPAQSFKLSDYSLELQEASVMKVAQHHMRFREYDEASYKFSELANLYVQENRWSEAKWYFLQSTIISRQQFDDKHTITNLMALAVIKANLGDLELAQADLVEARQLAVARGWTGNVTEIDREAKSIKLIVSTPKTELRYADNAVPMKKAAATDKKRD